MSMYETPEAAAAAIVDRAGTNQPALIAFAGQVLDIVHDMVEHDLDGEIDGDTLYQVITALESAAKSAN